MISLRVVLPVAVDLDRDVEAVLQRVLVAGLHGAADTEVERERRRPPRPPARHARAVRVGRAVVDDDDLELRVGGADLLDDGAEGLPPRLGGDDRDRAKAARGALRG